ncbi:MAG: hypothetical protein ACI31F_02500 [Muribaculaceae bacterium]
MIISKQFADYRQVLQNQLLHNHSNHPNHPNHLNLLKNLKFLKFLKNLKSSKNSNLLKNLKNLKNLNLLNLLKFPNLLSLKQQELQTAFFTAGSPHELWISLTCI